MTTHTTYSDKQRAEALWLADNYPNLSKSAIVRAVDVNGHGNLNNWVNARNAGRLEGLPAVTEARKTALRKKLGLDALLSDEKPVDAPTSDGTLDEPGTDLEPLATQAAPPALADISHTSGVAIVEMLREGATAARELAEARIALTEQRAEHDRDMRALVVGAADDKRILEAIGHEKDQQIKLLETALAEARTQAGRYRAIVALELSRNGVPA